MSTQESHHRRPKTQPKARRSPLLIAMGVVLVVAGALASAGVYTHLSHAQEVIVVVNAVERGSIIGKTDLALARVGVDPLLSPLPASDLDAVIGQYAQSDLVAGTFLTQEAIGQAIVPSTGRAQVGLALRPGEYPDGIRVGDKVLLVPVSSTGDDAATTPASFSGTVVAVSEPDANRTIHLSVDIDTDVAPTAAALSASNHLALVLLSRERP